MTVVEEVRAVAAGRFEGGMHVFGVADGAIDYVHEGPHAAGIPDVVKARVEELRKEISAGQIVVPTE